MISKQRYAMSSPENWFQEPSDAKNLKVLTCFVGSSLLFACNPCARFCGVHIIPRHRMPNTVKLLDKMLWLTGSSLQQQVGMERGVLCSLTHSFSTYFIFDLVLGTCHILINKS